MRLWSGLRPDACGERNCDTVVRQRHILLSVQDKRATPLESWSSNSWHRGQDADTLRHLSHVDFSGAKGSHYLSLFSQWWEQYLHLARCFRYHVDPEDPKGDRLWHYCGSADRAGPPDSGNPWPIAWRSWLPERSADREAVSLQSGAVHGSRWRLFRTCLSPSSSWPSQHNFSNIFTIGLTAHSEAVFAPRFFQRLFPHP